MAHYELTSHDLNRIILTHLKDLVVQDFCNLTVHIVPIDAAKDFNNRLEQYYKNEKDNNNKKTMIQTYKIPIGFEDIYLSEQYDKSLQIFLFAKKIFNDGTIPKIITDFPVDIISISGEKTIDQKQLKLAIVNIFKDLTINSISTCIECEAIEKSLLKEQEEQKQKAANRDIIDTHIEYMINDINTRRTNNSTKKNVSYKNYLIYSKIFDYIMATFL